MFTGLDGVLVCILTQLRPLNIKWQGYCRIKTCKVNQSLRFSSSLKRSCVAYNQEKFLLPSRERTRHLKDFSRQFLVQMSRQHRDVLTQMGLENFCVEPYFSNLRNNMQALVEVLAAVVAGLPQQHYGFYRLETLSGF